MNGEQIKQAVDEIIDEMKKEKFTHYTVNWGDLECVEVTDIVQTYPATFKQWTEVLIEEADPTAREFAWKIEERVFEKHGENIIVRTAW